MSDWLAIEKQIIKEINLLKSNLLLSPYEQNDPVRCFDCLFRRIALLIVGGQIKLQKIIFINKNPFGIDESGITYKDKKNTKKHGAEWHNSRIALLTDYFVKSNYKVISEPNLYYGRADLGVPSLKLFIEIGTINLYKLFINLFHLKDVEILILAHDDSILRFYKI